MRQHVRAVLHTLGRQRGLFVLVLLVVCVDGTPAVAFHGATALTIVVTRHWVYDMPDLESPVGPPDVTVFDKTVTDVAWVLEAQTQLDRSQLFGLGDCTIGSPEYVYQLRFETLGVTTQVYTGSDDCGGWWETMLGTPTELLGIQLAVRAVTLDGVEILNALHARTGMPCECWYGPPQN